MKLDVVICLLLTCIFAKRSLQNCLTPNDHRPPNPNGAKGLYTGQQEFSLDMLQAINKLNPDENLFFSPYSTYHALLIAYFMSGNTTEQYLRKTLKLDPSHDKADIFSAYKFDKLATQIRSNNASYEFTNANRIYVAEQVPVRDCVPALFDQELQRINFASDPESVRKTINNWVEYRTHNLIKDLLPSGTIDANTNLVLVNAAYFKGIWETQFDPANTKQEIFYITPSKQTFVDMMHVEGGFNHDISESLMAHILELPYQGKEISMFILLPPFVKEDGVETILKRLTLDKFRSIVEDDSSLLPRTVQVSLPKFALEHSLELVPILESMGVGKLFKEESNLSVLTKYKMRFTNAIHKAKIIVDEKGTKAAAGTASLSNRIFVLEKLGVGNLFTDRADFTTLTEKGNVSLGSALHKARIEVTEVGTKAAAATVLFTFRSSRPIEPAQFNCNHPFVYLIYDKVEKAILFTGVFRRPY